MTPTFSPMTGFLVIDKPSGLTSRDVVNWSQHCFPRSAKIGHTGTLDPLATGVLVLCIGKATRYAEIIQGMTKTYLAEILFGFTSDTDDADGKPIPYPVGDPPPAPPTREVIEALLPEFRGTILQVPPAYSALKVNGRRAHKIARKGRKVELEARSVLVHRLEILRYEWPYLEIEIVCGKGTYVRSIARDLGQRLGCGGLVNKLRRTQVGPFKVEQGIGVDVSPSLAREKLLPVSHLQGAVT